MDTKQLKQLAIAVTISSTIAVAVIYVSLELYRPTVEALFDMRLGDVSQELEDTRRSVGLKLDSLSGKELIQRVSYLSKKTESLEKQLTSLQQIISPKNATEILTVARMKDEILAREVFERQVNSSLEETRKKVESMQNWLLGLFSTVIASLLGFAFILLRRTRLLYSTVQALEAELKAQQKGPSPSAP